MKKIIIEYSPPAIGLLALIIILYLGMKNGGGGSGNHTPGSWGGGNGMGE